MMKLLSKKSIKLFLPFYLYEFFGSLIFVVPIWILFFQSRGLSLTEVGFVISGVYFASTFLEYPSGIFADRFGRKNSLLISMILLIISYLIEVTSYSTTQFFIASLFVGSAWAFTSGAREALIYDFLKSKKLEKYNSKFLGVLDGISSIGGIISVLIGSVLYAMNTTLPYWVMVIAFFFGLISILFINEPRVKKYKINLTTYGQFKEGIRFVWKNPVIKSLLILYIPLFFFEDAWYNTNQPILVGLGLPIVLLGTYHGFRRLFGVIGGFTLPRLIGKVSHKTLIFSVLLLESIIWFVLGSDSLIFIIIFSYLLMMIHQFWVYVDADIVHKHIPSRIRATVLSARQMMISLIWILNPWLMGYLVNTFNRNYLFTIFGTVVLILGMGIFLFREKYLE